MFQEDSSYSLPESEGTIVELEDMNDLVGLEL